MSETIKRDTERECAVIEARTAGASWRAIGKSLGISHVRVIAIWQRFQREQAAQEAWRRDLVSINAEMAAKDGK